MFRNTSRVTVLRSGLFLLLVALANTSVDGQAPPQYSALDLGTFGGQYSTAVGINDLGQNLVNVYLGPSTGDTSDIYSGGTITNISGFGGIYTFGYGINNSGDVTGYSTPAAGGTSQGFYYSYSTGTLTNLGSLADNGAIGYGINNSGEVVGSSSGHVFTWSNGTITDHGSWGGAFAYGYTLNNGGQLAGYSYINGRGQAVVSTLGQDLSYPTLNPDYHSTALAINDSGLVTGASETLVSNGQNTYAEQHAFLYSSQDGSIIDLGVLPGAGGSQSSTGYSINNAGDVVGTSYQPARNGGSRGFLYTGGTMYDLNQLVSGAHAKISDGMSINSNGFIAANATVDGQSHAFILRPITTTSATSDPVNVSGTGTDTFVLQLSFNKMEAITLFGSEADARLMWFDPGDNTWKLAVEGNTGGTATFINGAYDPNSDFHLGYYGVDTTNDTVWAVINHNSEFAAGSLSAVPEPSTMQVIALGGALLLSGKLARARLKRSAYRRHNVAA